MITQEEFAEWKRNRVTKQVYSAIEAKIELLKDRLVGEVAHAADGAAATAGAILAFQDVLEIDYEESND